MSISDNPIDYLHRLAERLREGKIKTRADISGLHVIVEKLADDFDPESAIQLLRIINKLVSDTLRYRLEWGTPEHLPVIYMAVLRACVTIEPCLKDFIMMDALTSTAADDIAIHIIDKYFPLDN